ncbi:FtsX-like permease family protein [Actinoplanes solisilvae]|uniref:FtsX-like permease family protein n=1 Tax=Actinoplanes solisilvae TaxID=2486853 RepID=UPI000FDCAB7D|nr:ABC transporter permease [Actinoplanes solisilvae]
MSVLRTQLRGVARRPARLLLTGLAVLVVSFVVYATVLAQQITERSLLDGLSGTPETVDVVARNGTLDSAQLAAINKLPGVAESTARLEVGAELGNEYLNLASDPGTGPLAVTKVTQGRYPSKGGEIAVTARTAERLSLPVGGTTQAVVSWDDNGKGRPPVKLTVVGLVEAPVDYGANGFAPTSALTALTGVKQFQRVDLDAAPGTDPATLRDRVEALMTSSIAKADERAEVLEGATVRQKEAEETASGVNAVFAVIGAFVGIAVLAAGLVATSTFRIVFAQRMRQLALLRAVGAGRRSITWALAVEGALTGLVTGLTGVLLALGVGHLVPAVAGWNDMQVASPGFPLPAALGTVLLAVLLTVLAVLAPAASASKVSPLEALRGAGTTGARGDIGKLRWATGILLAAGAVLAVAYVATNLPGRDPKDYDPTPMLFAVIASAGFAFFALVVLGPVLVRPVLALLGWPIRRFSPVGRLAAGGVGAAPRRAAAVSVVVALGVALVGGALVGGSSLRVLLDRETASAAPADYELTAQDDATVPAALTEQLKQRDELKDVTGYRRLPVKIGDMEGLDVTDLKVGALPELKKLDVSSGSFADVGPGKVALSGFGSDITGAGVGDQIEIKTDKRTVRVTVVAKLPADAPLHATALLDPSDLTRLGAPAAFSGVLANAAVPGEEGRTDGKRAISEVQGAAGGKWQVAVLADQRDEINDQVTLLLVIALGLVGLTVIIAVVGVGTTTALSVVERVRESGVLRAVGLSRAGLRTMMTTESALYGVIGAALGLALGVPYAWLFVRALGVNAPLTLPVGQLVVVFALLVALTALAGVLPARRAAKVSPVAALATE